MQLKMKDITNYIIKLKNEGMSLEEINELPIYLGNDDELNGVHCGWYFKLIDSKDKEDDFVIDMINNDSLNIKLNGKGILIS